MIEGNLAETIELGVVDAKTGLEFVAAYIQQRASTLLQTDVPGRQLREVQDVQRVVDEVQKHVASLSETTNTITTPKMREVTREDVHIGDHLHVLFETHRGRFTFSGVLVNWNEIYLHLDGHKLPSGDVQKVWLVAASET